MNPIELAKKLQALAEKGVGGEKRNAQVILEGLMKKYDLNLEQLESEEKKRYHFTIPLNSPRYRLFSQIVHRVSYDMDIFYYKRRRKFNIFIECSLAQYIEINQMYQVFWKLYEKELEVFYSAFITANDLLAQPPEDKRRSTDDLSPEELEEWLRIQQMAQQVKRETVRKQLQSAGDDTTSMKKVRTKFNQ